MIFRVYIVYRGVLIFGCEIKMSMSKISIYSKLNICFIILSNGLLSSKLIQSKIIFQFDFLNMCLSFPVCYCKATDLDEEQTKGLVAGVLTVLEEVDGTVVNVAVIIEENIVLQHLPDLPTAFAYLLSTV